MVKERSLEKEWLDLKNAPYSKQEYENCLAQLDRIGKYLGGDNSTFSILRKMQKTPESILEVGCGGGFFSLRLAEAYPETQVIGIDLNPWAIEFAEKLRDKKGELKNRVRFATKNFFELHDDKFDLIIATLTCHHFTNSEMVEFLKKSYQISHTAILINDLHRHRMASLAFSLIAPIFFPNPLIFHDGLISIRRGFIYEEWEKYLQEAKISKNCCTIYRRFPFRWVVWAQKESQSL